MSSPNNLRSKPRYFSFRNYFLLIVLSGILVLVFSYIFAREEKLWQAGISAGKLGFWSAYILLLAAALFHLANAYKPGRIIEKLEKKLFSLYADRKLFDAFSLVLGLILGTAIALVVFLEQPSPNNPGFYYLFYGYGFLHPLLYWLVIDLAVTFIFTYFDLFKIREGEITGDRLSVMNGVILVIAATLIILLVGFLIFTLQLIVFRIPFETVFSYWFYSFKIEIPPLEITKFLFVVGLGSSGLLALIFSNLRRKGLWLLLFGVALQFLYPFVQDGSLIRTEYRIGNYGSGTYIQTACSYATFSDYYQNYEELSGGNSWLVTKPPGYLAPHFFFKNLLAIGNPEVVNSPEDCELAIQSFLISSSSFISMVALLIILLISKRYYPKEQAYLPVLVYILMPNLILFTGMVDQYLIPIPFAILLFLSIETVRNQRLIFASLTGLWYYICVLYSFTLIGTLGFPLILIAVNYLKNIHREKFGKSLLLGVVLVGTATVCELIVSLFTDYSTFDLLTRALQSHYAFVYNLDPIKQFFDNIEINNAEYLFWIGTPVILLLLAGIFRASVSDQIQDRSNKVILVITGILFYVLLNVSGQNRAETARLWIILNQPIALIAPIFLGEFSEKTRKVILISFVVLQLSLTFIYNLPFYDHFQDGIQIR